jgi:DNA-binding MarR family transcriptional regulator
MESRGHIERSSCPEDGRGSYVAVTPIGRSAIEQAAPAHVEQVRALLFEGMSESEMHALTEVSERVMDRLARVL